MCFSASASFTAAVVLIPVGGYCLKKAQQIKQPYWVFALLPLLFGVQQLFEGGVWLALEANDITASRTPALGFMFFSHFFWLVWIPFACYVVETRPKRKKVFFAFTLLGGIHGALMYFPLFVHHDWLVLELIRHSIVYKATLFYDEYVPRIVVRALYAFIVLVPLLLCSKIYVRIFGVIIALSVIFATVVFGYAFISVWCYFAALLSLYMVFMVYRLAKVAVN